MNQQEFNNYLRLKTTIVRSVLVAMMVMFASSFAVQANEPKPQTDEEYAMVIARGKLLNITKWKVEVDFGQKLEIGFKNKDLLRDDEGKVIDFNSPMDALNYLNQSGWVLVTANTSGDQFSAIMKRSKITDNES
ncbi:hypothetical protein [Vibrio superstes]|uniref:Uncharacterized protein n=1 Tax=Vibrio superstes NBRC 103154 TaxID=1219062 RepID=A0A511QNG4_9VIBR|nr:hypothetical protein [Vibrio superstes]GEM78871.1 hypothetical protein VSU01S_11160 [Vibrio superstes NBRC 103154]